MCEPPFTHPHITYHKAAERGMKNDSMRQATLFYAKTALLGIVVSAGACRSAPPKTVRAVVEFQGTLFPFPRDWTAYKSKNGGIIFRLTRLPKDAWIQFDAPSAELSAQAMASKTLTGRAAVKQSSSFYGKRIWQQTISKDGHEQFRGIIETSKGAVAFRGLLRDELKNSGDATEGQKQILGWADAPKESVPENIQRMTATPDGAKKRAK